MAKNKPQGDYIEHLTDNPEMGQAQVLVAGEKDVDKTPKTDTKVGNQDKTYYEDY